MATLYELSNDYINLIALADDPDIDEQAFMDTLEGIEGALEDKADSYAVVIAEIEAKVDKYKKEIDRLTALKKAGETTIDRVKRNLEGAMRATGKIKFDTDFHKFSIQKNPASLVIDDETKVPVHFLKIKEEINKAAIKDAIKAGEEFDFCHMEQSESLRIK
jgi:hypothetical protein